MPIIPKDNPMALIGYYVGMASLIPCLGCITGPIAIILGIIGAIKANSNPAIGGMGHAITAIVLGLVGGTIWGVLISIAGMFNQ